METCNKLTDGGVCGKIPASKSQEVIPIYSQTSEYPIEYVKSGNVEFRCEEHSS